MTLTDGIDELIRETKRQMALLSTECEQEIKSSAARIREKYAHKIAKFSDSLAHLEAVRANHSGGSAALHPPSAQKQARARGDVQARNKKFRVTEEVEKIVKVLRDEYSLDDVYKLFDKRHPGIRQTLNRTSIHRALNLLVTKSGKVEKVGPARYRNRKR